MGTKRSKPRKRRARSQHLPKVGSPAHRAQARENRMRVVFGSGFVRALMVALLVVALIGMVAVAL